MYPTKHLHHRRVVVYAKTLGLAQKQLIGLAHCNGLPVHLVIDRDKFFTLDYEGGTAMGFEVDTQPTRTCADFIYIDRDLTQERVEHILEYCKSGMFEYFN